MRSSGRSSNTSGAERGGRVPRRALIFDPQAERRKRLEELLSRLGFSARALTDEGKLRRELLSGRAEVVFLGVVPGKGFFPSPRRCPPFAVIALGGESPEFRADLALPPEFGPRELEGCLGLGLRLARLKRALHRARRLNEGFRRRERRLRKVRHALNNFSMIVEGYITLESMGHPSAKERAPQVLRDQVGRLEFISEQLEQAMAEGG